jgi:L-fuconolactonase
MLDAHQHFWRFNEAEYGWIDPSMSVLRRDFLPEDLLQLGVENTVAVQARQSLEETRWLLSLAKEFPLIRGVVGWVPLIAPDVSDVLEELSEDRKLRGVRHVLQDEKDDRYMLRDDFNRGVELLAPLSLRYDILIFERQLPQAIEFVDRHPNQIFILDHIAKPKIYANEIEPWRTNLKELAKRGNVFCKISGMVSEARNKAWMPRALRPYFDAAVEAFTPRRLMFGSDWPVCLVVSEYHRWVQTVRDWSRDFSSVDKYQLFGATCAEAYGLDAQ